MTSDTVTRYHAPAIGVGIRAVGRALPDRVVTNAELEQRFDTTDQWIRDNIGVRTRRVSAPNEGSGDLGARALLDACEQAGVSVDSVDLVICGTYTPDHMIPANALSIMRRVGLTSATGFDVNSGGCPGGVFALDVGAKYVASGEYRRVAVVLADVNTKTFDPTDRTVGVIFGDGAACYLLEPTAPGTGIGRTVLRSDPSRYHIAYVSRQPRVAADGTPIKSYFGDNFAVMIGREVRDFALEIMPAFVAELVDKEGFRPDDIDLYLLHQANLHIIHAIMERLGQPVSKTVTNVERNGNTSGAGLALAMRDAIDAGRLNPGDRVVLAAFGAGMNYGGMIIRWCGPDDFQVAS